MAGVGGEPWVERKLRIPTDKYPQLRPLLGWLAVTQGIEVSTVEGEPTGETVAMYNEDKVVWVVDPDPDGVDLRPVIPFSRLLRETDPARHSAASRLVGAIKSTASRALYEGTVSDSRLLDFVYFKRVPLEEVGERRFEVRGLYADRALELAHSGEILERAHDVGADSIAFFWNFCEDLVLPNTPSP